MSGSDLVDYVFTSATVNYFGKVRTLAQTLKRWHPEAHFVLVLVDRASVDLLRVEPAIDEVLLVDDLDIPVLKSWLFRRSVVEACTGVKGAALQSLLTRADCRTVIYLDPDVAVLGPLTPVFDALAKSSIAVTPHLAEPELTPQGVIDHEIATLRMGIFNVGFVGVRPDSDGHAFAGWWSQRLIDWCFDDVEAGLFTDQRWVDLALGFFEGIEIIRHPGCNVATWNISRRTITRNPVGRYLVNGEPLAFFHFSGLDSGAQLSMLERYARHQSTAFEIRRWYTRQCARNELRATRQAPWAFSCYDDGLTVAPEHRDLYRRRVDVRETFPDPFRTTAPCFRDWFDAERQACLLTSPADSAGGGLPALLFITHYGGGGTEVHVQSLVELVAGRCQPVILRPTLDGGIHLSGLATPANGNGNIEALADEDLDALVATLKAQGLRRVHLHHLLGCERWIGGLLERLALPFDVTLHDYYFASANPFLLRAGRFVGDEGLDDIDDIPYPGTRMCAPSAEEWRGLTLPILTSADRVIAPSHDLATRYSKLVPGLDLTIQRHPERPRPELLPIRAAQVSGDEPLRVLALNAGVSHKGSEVVLRAAELAAASGLPLEFHLLGEVADSRLERASYPLFCHGSYQLDALPTLLRGISPNVGWCPAQWPEAYCYALSEMMRAGLPIVASNLGALPERLAGRPASWIAAWDSPTEVWLDAFVRLWEGSLPRLERPSFDHPRITHDPPGADGFYDTGYLAWL